MGIVFGTASRRANQPFSVEGLFGTAEAENTQPIQVQAPVQAPVQAQVQVPVQAPVEPVKANRGWETNTQTITQPAKTVESVSPLQEKKTENKIAAPAPAPVAPPKPTSWAGLVANSNEENQQTVSNVPAPAPAVAEKAPVAVTEVKTEKRERKEGKGGKGGARGGKGERRERSDRRGGKGERGKGGKGRNGKGAKHTIKQAPTLQQTQAKADAVFARQIQAQVNLASGTGKAFENEWAVQSKKGGAVKSRMAVAGP